MEVEEDADTEREDLKAREARKKVLVYLYRYLVFRFVHMYYCLLLIARQTHSKYKFLILPDSLKESLPHHHPEQFNHLLLLRIMIQKVPTISVLVIPWMACMILYDNYQWIM